MRHTFKYYAWHSTETSLAILEESRLMKDTVQYDIAEDDSKFVHDKHMKPSEDFIPLFLRLCPDLVLRVVDAYGEACGGGNLIQIRKDGVIALHTDISPVYGLPLDNIGQVRIDFIHSDNIVRPGHDTAMLGVRVGETVGYDRAIRPTISDFATVFRPGRPFVPPEEF